MTRRESITSILLAVASLALGYLVGRWHADYEMGRTLEPLSAIGRFLRSAGW